MIQKRRIKRLTSPIAQKMCNKTSQQMLYKGEFLVCHLYVFLIVSNEYIPSVAGSVTIYQCIIVHLCYASQCLYLQNYHVHVVSIVKRSSICRRVAKQTLLIIAVVLSIVSLREQIQVTGNFCLLPIASWFCSILFANFKENQP